MTALPTDPTLPPQPDPTMGEAAEAAVNPPAPDPTAPPTPAPTPEAPALDPKEFTRLQAIEQEHQNLSKFVEVLRAQGITNPDDLQTNLTLIGRMNKNADLKGMIEAAVKTGEAPSAQPKTDPGQLSQEGVSTLIQEKITEALEAQETRRAQSEYQNSSTIEGSLKAKVLQDPRFQKIMGDVSFGDALQGKGSKSAKAFAILADQFFYDRGTGTDGTYKPVTSEAAIGDVATDLIEVFNELRAATLLDASTAPVAAEAPDAPTNVQTVEGKEEFDLIAPHEFTDPESALAKKAGQTFEASYKQAYAARRRMPGSQG